MQLRGSPWGSGPQPLARQPAAAAMAPPALGADWLLSAADARRVEELEELEEEQGVRQPGLLQEEAQGGAACPGPRTPPPAQGGGCVGRRKLKLKLKQKRPFADRALAGRRAKRRQLRGHGLDETGMRRLVPSRPRHSSGDEPTWTTVISSGEDTAVIGPIGRQPSETKLLFQLDNTVQLSKLKVTESRRSSSRCSITAARDLLSPDEINADIEEDSHRETMVGSSFPWEEAGDTAANRTVEEYKPEALSAPASKLKVTGKVQLGSAERVRQYLRKRAVQVTPPPACSLQLACGPTEALSLVGPVPRPRPYSAFAPRCTRVTDVQIMGHDLRVMVTNEATAVDTWIQTNLTGVDMAAKPATEARLPSPAPVANSEPQEPAGQASSSGDPLLLGLDLEWRPNRWPGANNPVALLQLAIRSECLLVQMLFLDTMPQSLKSFLESPGVKLGGVGVRGDAERLLRDHGIDCAAQVQDLNVLAVERLESEECRTLGLKQLAQRVLGHGMLKHKATTMSDWARCQLEPTQVKYAAADAWVSLAILNKLWRGTFPETTSELA